MVDTAFVATLGVVSLAALGVGTMALSSFYWIFNFLGIGTQTEVAKAEGRSQVSRVAELSVIAGSLAIILGLAVGVAGWFASPVVASLLGAAGDVADQAAVYMRLRWIGAPAVLVMVAGFGVLRGLQDMKTPLYVAVGVNGLNIFLDYILIFGWGQIPAMGIAGAAAATTISQWLGAVALAVALIKRVGIPGTIHWGESRGLLKVGGDLFVRTGGLSLFLLLATRSATAAGPEAGAVHQAIRQVWFFTALFLDSFAVSGQSLVAYFLGADWVFQARRVAFFVCSWSFGTGILLGLSMLLLSNQAIALFIPDKAVALFGAAWLAAALFQPLNSISFATDGVHWGTGDFRYLRNVVLLATMTGVVALNLLDEQEPHALAWIWWITGLWVTIRAAFGILRIWPGIGTAPLQPSIANPEMPSLTES